MFLSQKKYWESPSLNSRRHPEHPVIFSFVKTKIREITKIIPLKKEHKILDLGAGNGFYSYQFDKICEVIAVDFSKKMIAMNPVNKKVIMDAENLGFKDNTFDIVFESCILHHVENIDKVIFEMVRVSKKYIIITEPNILNPLVFLNATLKKHERKLLSLRINQIIDILSSYNIKIVSLFKHGIIAPNLTPTCFLKFIALFDLKIPILGMDTIIIATKQIS